MAGRDDQRRPGAPGAIKAITSLANPAIKELRALGRTKGRRETGLFIAEGLKLVADAHEAGWRAETLVHGPRVADMALLKRLAAATHAAGGTVIETGEAALAKITRRDNPQMVVGVFRQRFVEPREVKPGRSGVWVALEQVRDPGNLGTILRTVDSVGADGVILVGDTVDPFSIEAVRASMGSIFHVPVAEMSAEAFTAWRKSFPGRVVGTHLSGKLDYRRVDYAPPVLLLMGPEQAGLSDRMAALCDDLVRIPMAGKADSLNLAIATGIMLYEIRRAALPEV